MSLVTDYTSCNTFYIGLPISLVPGIMKTGSRPCETDVVEWGSLRRVLDAGAHACQKRRRALTFREYRDGSANKSQLNPRKLLGNLGAGRDTLIIPSGIAYIERVIVNHPVSWEVSLGKLRETCYCLRILIFRPSFRSIMMWFHVENCFNASISITKINTSATAIVYIA